MIRIMTILMAVAAALAASVPAGAQTRTDSVAIRATALDYAEGWYSGDATRMQRALHPQLTKRMVEGTGAASQLDVMTSPQLVAATRNGGGRRTPASSQRKDVRILDVHGKAASVRLRMNGWVDYLHMVKWQDRWVIINVLWEYDEARAG